MYTENVQIPKHLLEKVVEFLEDNHYDDAYIAALLKRLKKIY